MHINQFIYQSILWLFVFKTERASLSQTRWEKFNFSSLDAPCLPLFGCLFSYSLKCFLTVSIYYNRPLSVCWNICNVPRKAESWSPSISLHRLFTRTTADTEAAWAARLVVESWVSKCGRGLGGISNSTESHDWKEEMAHAQLPLLTKIKWG